MNPYVVRAKILAAELEIARRALGIATTPGAAAVFLDRLARLECMPEEVLNELGLVQTAQRERDIAGVELGAFLSDTLAITDLPERAGRLASGDEVWRVDDGVVSWALDLLLVAGVAPWLPNLRAVEKELGEALAWVDSHPRAFLDLPQLAADRRAGEDATPDLQNRVLLRFAEVALVALFDEHGVEDATAAEDALDKLLLL